jgi:hypothetical protein
MKLDIEKKCRIKNRKGVRRSDRPQVFLDYYSRMCDWNYTTRIKPIKK